MIRNLNLSVLIGLLAAIIFSTLPVNATILPEEDLTWEVLIDSTVTYMNQKNYQTALVLAKKSLMQADIELGELDTNYARTLSTIVAIYFYSNNIDSAFVYAEKTVEKARKSYKPDQLTLTVMIRDLAYLNDLKGRQDESEVLYKEIVDLKKGIYNVENEDLATSIYELGYIFNSHKKLSEAEFYMKESLEMFKRVYKSDHKNVALILNDLGFVNKAMGKLNEAITLFKESLDMYRRLYSGDNTGILSPLDNLGLLYTEIGRLSEAEPLKKELCDILRRLYKSDNPKLEMSINNLGLLYAYQGRFSEAEVLFKEALEMGERLYKGDNASIAIGLDNLGEALVYQGRLSEAEALLQESLDMNRRIAKGDNKDLAGSMSNLGVLYRHQLRLKEAETLFKESIAMLRRLYKEDNPDIAICLTNLSTLYSLMNRLTESESLALEALEMRRRIYNNDHPILAIGLNNLATLYLNQDKFDKAEPLFLEALEMNQRIYKGDHFLIASTLNNLGSLYNELGRIDLADSILKESVEMSRRVYKGIHTDLAISILNLCAFYESHGRYSDEEPLFKEGLEMYKEIYKKNSSNLSESEREKYWGIMTNAFEGFNYFAMLRMKDNPTILGNAFDNLLFSKAILFNSSNKIKKRILESGDLSLKAKYKEFTSKKEMLIKLYSLPSDEIIKQGYNIDSLEKIANELEKDISLNSGSYKRFDKKKFNWNTIQNFLKSDDAAIEIVRFRLKDNERFTDTVYYAALILKSDSKSPELVLLENGNDLESIHIKNYRNLIKNKLQDNESYNQFWAKIAPKLKGMKKVYFSPDGVYNQINLATLYNPKTKKYLLDEMEIQVVTSTRDIVENKERKTPEYNNTAVLIGNPRFNMDKDEYKKIASSIDNKFKPDYYLSEEAEISMRSGIHPLPGTGIEIDKIGRLLGINKWNVEKYSDNLAIEEVVKKTENPRILHIATHGKFLSDIERNYSDFNSEIDRQRYVENPLLRSYLIFAGADRQVNPTPSLPTREGESNIVLQPDETEDGFLTAYEAQNLFLDKTELVVLSACETGLGEIRNGEGVYGLQRAFIQAGARSLIMSLWSVSDEATQELMVSFYQKWLSGKTKRQAFREAQQELKAKYLQPYYWGAFVMVGE
jgi:CHAT domain-containing protein